MVALAAWSRVEATAPCCAQAAALGGRRRRGAGDLAPCMRDPSPCAGCIPWYAAQAPVVEVVGSRFLRRYGKDSSVAASTALPWQLRFPRISQWAEASPGAVPDTVASFAQKTIAAFACTAAQGDGQRAGAGARAAVALAAHGRGAAPESSLALGHGALAGPPAQQPLHQPLQQPLPQPLPPLGWAREPTPPERSQHQTWDEVTRPHQPPPRLAVAAAAAVPSPSPPRQTRTSISALLPPGGEQDWDSGDTSEELERRRQAQQQQQPKRSRR